MAASISAACNTDDEIAGLLARVLQRFPNAWQPLQREMGKTTAAGCRCHSLVSELGSMRLDWKHREGNIAQSLDAAVVGSGFRDRADLASMGYTFGDPNKIKRPRRGLRPRGGPAV